jgi:hypothetical protein
MHIILLLQKKIEEDVKNPLKGEVERQPTKKNQIQLAMELSNFLLPKNLLKGSYITNKSLEDMALLIV